MLIFSRHFQEPKKKPFWGIRNEIGEMRADNKNVHHAIEGVLESVSPTSSARFSWNVKGIKAEKLN